MADRPQSIMPFSLSRSALSPACSLHSPCTFLLYPALSSVPASRPVMARAIHSVLHSRRAPPALLCPPLFCPLPPAVPSTLRCPRPCHPHYPVLRHLPCSAVLPAIPCCNGFVTSLSAPSLCCIALLPARYTATLSSPCLTRPTI